MTTQHYGADADAARRARYDQLAQWPRLELELVARRYCPNEDIKQFTTNALITLIVTGEFPAR